jgi:hypothetical protein
MADYYVAGTHWKSGTWHGKESESGGVVNDPVLRTPKHFVRLAEGDYNVDVLPAVVELPDGEEFTVPDKYWVMRPPIAQDDKWKAIRQIGNRYHVHQNMELADIITPLSEEWPIDGFMILKDGKIISFVLEIGDYYVADMEEEKHKSYLYVCNDHTQGAGIFGETHVRVVCWNTHMASIGGDDMVTFPHTQDSAQILQFLSSIKLHTIEHRQQTIDRLNAMFTRKISNEEFADVVDATFPAPNLPKGLRLAELMPEDMDQNAPGVEYVLGKAATDQKLLTWQHKRSIDLRTALGGEFSKFNDTYPYAAQTSYAAWNSATAVINHSDLFTGAQEKQMVSLFFGQKRVMTDRAWDAVSKLD